MTARSLAAALALAVVVVALVLVAHSPRLRAGRLAVPAGALVGVVALVAFAGGFAAYHRLDRGRTPTGLERTLLALGPEQPAVVIGVADLRAVLGPRLERPLIKVSRGGAAEEIPFADEAQIRRRVLGDETASLPPPELGPALDEAIEEAGPSILVTGGVSPTGYPDGWLPAAGWCLAGGDREGTVFVRPELLPAGATCVSASEL